ncbi:MAG: hypothetical protein LBD41_02255, partial [Clostridiales Family XIII bacterium]|nr:hypothetical protein [Clostridiales Family XIII bacterium]
MSVLRTDTTISYDFDIEEIIDYFERKFDVQKKLNIVDFRILRNVKKPTSLKEFADKIESFFPNPSVELKERLNISINSMHSMLKSLSDIMKANGINVNADHFTNIQFGTAKYSGTTLGTFVFNTDTITLKEDIKNLNVSLSTLNHEFFHYIHNKLLQMSQLGFTEAQALLEPVKQLYNVEGFYSDDWFSGDYWQQVGELLARGFVIYINNSYAANFNIDELTEIDKYDIKNLLAFKDTRKQVDYFKTFLYDLTYNAPIIELFGNLQRQEQPLIEGAYDETTEFGASQSFGTSLGRGLRSEQESLQRLEGVSEQLADRQTVATDQTVDGFELQDRDSTVNGRSDSLRGEMDEESEKGTTTEGTVLSRGDLARGPGTLEQESDESVRLSIDYSSFGTTASG